MKRVFLRGTAETFANYITALTACGLEPVASLDLGLAANCDGLLVPGGADVDPARYGQKNTASVGIDPDRDRDELTLIRQFLALEKPILGICRGHQILNVALGGDLIQDLPGHRQRPDGPSRPGGAPLPGAALRRHVCLQQRPPSGHRPSGRGLARHLPQRGGHHRRRHPRKWPDYRRPVPSGTHGLCSPPSRRR